MRNLDKFGMNPVITNFVRNELTKDRAIRSKAILEKVTAFFKDEDFFKHEKLDVTQIEDLVHHLASEMFN